MTYEDNRGIGGLLQTLIDQIARLMRDEIALMKAEAGEKARLASRGAAMMAIGIVIALPALFILLLSGVLALSMVVELWLAALIVGAAAALVAIAFVLGGRANLTMDKLTPRRTILSVKRDAQFAGSHLSEGI